MKVIDPVLRARRENGCQIREPGEQIDDTQAADPTAYIVVLQPGAQRRPRFREIVLFPESRPREDDEEEPDLEKKSHIDQPANQNITLVSGPSRAGRRYA